MLLNDWSMDQNRSGQDLISTWTWCRGSDRTCNQVKIVQIRVRFQIDLGDLRFFEHVVEVEVNMKKLLGQLDFSRPGQVDLLSNWTWPEKIRSKSFRFRSLDRRYYRFQLFANLHRISEIFNIINLEKWEISVVVVKKSLWPPSLLCSGFNWNFLLSRR